MKQFSSIVKNVVASVIALLGLASLSNQAIAQTVPAHQGTHSPPAPESKTTSPLPSTAAIKDDVATSKVTNAETQSPPGVGVAI